jgi:hypothetical protein
MRGPQPREGVRSSAFHLHGHGAHLVGLGGGDSEQSIPVHGLELLALDRDGEAEAAAPGAVAELAQQGASASDGWPTSGRWLRRSALISSVRSAVCSCWLSCCSRRSNSFALRSLGSLLVIAGALAAGAERFRQALKAAPDDLITTSTWPRRCWSWIQTSTETRPTGYCCG